MRSLHPEKVLSVLPVNHVIRTADQQKTVSEYYRTITPLLDETRNKLSNLQKEKSEIEKESPYSLTTVSVSPKTTRILPRGNWMDDSGEIVTPNTPTFLKNIEVEGQPATRLDLANWVVSPKLLSSSNNTLVNSLSCPIHLDPLKIFLKNDSK